MTAPTRRTLRAQRLRIRRAGPYTVVSLANGQLTVQPAWPGCGPKDHDTKPDRYCAQCDCYHIGGIFSRLDLAEAIEALLNRSCR